MIDFDRSGEVWQCDVSPWGFRIHLVLCRSTESAEEWDTLILFDQGNGEEGQMERLTEETFIDRSYWSQLL